MPFLLCSDTSQATSDVILPLGQAWSGQRRRPPPPPRGGRVKNIYFYSGNPLAFSVKCELVCRTERFQVGYRNSLLPPKTASVTIPVVMPGRDVTAVTKRPSHKPRVRTTYLGCPGPAPVHSHSQRGTIGS